MLFFRSCAVKELDALIEEMKQYLQNNYKSLAHDARIKLGERTEQLRQEGKLTEKEYKKYAAVYKTYTERLANYHH